MTNLALRNALGENRAGVRYIATVAGRGYCFVAPVQGEDGPAVAASSAEKSAAALPVPITRMIGRDEAVVSLLSEMHTRGFVTIVGPGASVRRGLPWRSPAASARPFSARCNISIFPALTIRYFCRLRLLRCWACQALAFPAIELLAERASMGFEDFELTDADVPAAVSICMKLDGLVNFPMSTVTSPRTSK
jgi:hypothetical protein